MIKTLVVDNFRGSMTPVINGDLNSGRSYWLDVSGYDPFSKPNNLTWNENPVQIDPTYSVVTDLIMDSKTRLESGILYVYAIGHTGRLYKIQVNDPTTYNPDYDNPVLLATLTSGTPTFTRGGFMDFFGATERIYIGHDKGVTRIDFDGTNETALSGTWVQNVPRPMKQFVGKLYIGNGNNTAEIDSTATVTSSTKLSPAFPSSTQVRDIDFTSDGNYLQFVVTESILPDITSIAVDTSVIAPTSSYIFLWNGVDIGYTSFNFYPSIVLEALTTFGSSQYLFGYDSLGQATYDPSTGRRILTSLPDTIVGPSIPNTIISYGNMVEWVSTLTYDGFSYALFLTYGTLSDYDFPQVGYWCPLFHGATGTETDVLRVLSQTFVSNISVGASTSGYNGNIVGIPKVYFSTLETSDTPTTKYKLYKWPIFPTGLGTPLTSGLFQTQNQIFSKKVQIKEVRIYGQPWVSGNSFIMDLIGSDDQPISGGTFTFTAGTNLEIGDDRCWYNPQIGPLYSMAIRISNLGDVNHIINKVEIDYSDGGE